MFQPWMHGFFVDGGGPLEVPIWVKLLRLPLPLWPFMERIMALLGIFVYVEQSRFYRVQPFKRVYVKIDLSNDLKDRLVDLSNTCY